MFCFVLCQRQKIVLEQSGINFVIFCFLKIVKPRKEKKCPIDIPMKKQEKRRKKKKEK